MLDPWMLHTDYSNAVSRVMARKGKENEGGKGSSSRLAHGSICLMIN
jgi:hypothetical protein